MSYGTVFFQLVLLDCRFLEDRVISLKFQLMQWELQKCISLMAWMNDESHPWDFSDCYATIWKWWKVSQPLPFYPLPCFLFFFSGSGSSEFHHVICQPEGIVYFLSYWKEETGHQIKKLALSVSRSRAPTFLGLTERSTQENVGQGE